MHQIKGVKYLMNIDEKFNKLVNQYGIAAINLCIKRHDLTTHKRDMWNLQFQLYKEDEEKNKQQIEQIKSLIDEQTKEIEEIDLKLLDYGINSKNRPSIIKTIKQTYPKDWFGGFIED